MAGGGNNNPGGVNQYSRGGGRGGGGGGKSRTYTGGSRMGPGTGGTSVIVKGRKASITMALPSGGRTKPENISRSEAARKIMDMRSKTKAYGAAFGVKRT